MESSSEATRKEPCSTRQQRLSVIVFRGDPIDATMFRHVGLLLEHLEEGIDGTPHATIAHTTFLQVTGSAGGFERDESPASTCGDPRENELFAGIVHVATTPATGASDRRLRNAIWATAVNNAEASWNCQNWVGDALNSCVGAGLVLADQVDGAIDGMTDLILQATDIV